MKGGREGRGRIFGRSAREQVGRVGVFEVWEEDRPVRGLVGQGGCYVLQRDREGEREIRRKE